MKIALCLILLPLCLMVMSGTLPEEPQFKKGDEFHVSALLNYTSPKSRENLVIAVRVLPCYEPFYFKERLEGKELIIATDPRDLLFGFAGDWGDRIHATQDECMVKAKQSVPEVKLVEGLTSTRGRTYRIAPPAK
ncbi:MAG: hypothetical protein O7F16_00650 [Acidobacteria bacterium]|nr:hypothetical protein [Acidobacteriota bacterium]